jgi:hypothetical protein
VEITTRALRQLADDVDDQHHEAMATIHEDLREVHFGETSRVLAGSRRRFLRNAGLGGAALTLGSTLVPVGRLLPAAWAQETLDDADLAGFAQSVELAAVDAYTAAIETGLLDGSVVDVAEIFRRHHDEHAAAFAGVAGDAATDEANQAVLDVFAPQIADAADQDALLQIAQDLENGAASTYFYSLGILQDRDAALAVATILPIESQHAVVLGQALGQDLDQYVPTFQGQDGALSPTDYPVNS